MIVFEDEEPLSEEEIEVFAEYAETVNTSLRVTKDRDGGIFSTTYEVSLTTKVPPGGDVDAVEKSNRIFCTNKINYFFMNKRIKKIN